MNLAKLTRLLKKAWSRETSADPENWTPENSAWGQCAVTALVVQDFFGGGLLRGMAKIEKSNDINQCSHYWNRLSDGRELDLTEKQFTEKTVISKGEPRTRNYVLSFASTRERYTTLRLSIENLIQPNSLLSDSIYQMCFKTAQESECQKKKFGCVVLCRQGNKRKMVTAVANKTIEPIRDICEPECIRLKIQARTESVLGACGHAEEWALWETDRSKIPLENCSFYIAGFHAKNSTPWIKKERVHTCLRCAVQMYMAGVGKIYVPVIDHWESLTAAEALKTAKMYALKEKEIE